MYIKITLTISAGAGIQKAKALQPRSPSAFISFQSQLMTHVVEVSKIHLNSNSSAIRDQASKLLNFVPCSYSLVGLCFESIVTLGKTNKSPFACAPRSHVKVQLSPELIRIAQRHHIARGICGEIQPLQFRVFMSYLLQNNKPR